MYFFPFFSSASLQRRFGSSLPKRLPICPQCQWPRMVSRCLPENIEIKKETFNKIIEQNSVLLCHSSYFLMYSKDIVLLYKKDLFIYKRICMLVHMNCVLLADCLSK